MVYFVLMAKSPLKIILGLMMLLAVKGLQADPLNQWTWRFRIRKVTRLLLSLMAADYCCGWRQ